MKATIKKHLVTWLLVVLAVIAGWFIWQQYFNSLWTRDARVAARVIQVSSDVAGRITHMPLQEGQTVSKGQLLFSVDVARYKLAVAQAQAALSSRQTQLDLKRREAQRAQRLGNTISRQLRDQKNAAAKAAAAAVALAKAKLAIARLNLKRCRVVAPFNASVTRIGAYAGDYAKVGEPLVSLVKAHSYWIQAYFKETQVHHIHPHDAVDIQLLGYSKRLKGRVRSIGRGIADSNQLAGEQGLPSVQASFDWVRLAQRIPVEIDITARPADLLLSAGMTASVEVMPARH